MSGARSPAVSCGLAVLKLCLGPLVMAALGGGLLYRRFPVRPESRLEIKDFCEGIRLGESSDAVTARFKAGHYKLLTIYPYPDDRGPLLVVSTPLEITTQNWYCLVELDGPNGSEPGAAQRRVVSIRYRTEDDHSLGGARPKGAPADRMSDAATRAR